MSKDPILSKDIVLSNLSKLNKKELNEIIQVATSLLGNFTNNKDILIRELWIEAIGRVLSRNLPNTSLAKISTKTFNEAERFLESLITTNIRNRLGKAVIRKHLVELLLADLKKRKLTAGPTMLGNNLSTLPEVFDRAYPGWRQSGLIHMIWDKLGVK